MSKRRIAVCGAVLGSIACVAIYLWLGSKLSAPAHRPATPAPAHLEASVVRIPSESGAELVAWYSAPAQPVAAVVLLHCVRCNRVDMLSRAELLRRNEFAVLVPDLQAHGESIGEAITFGFLESRDAIASLAFLRRQHPELPIGAIGTSLGGAALALAGSSLEADAVVLEAVYPTIEGAVANRIAIRLGPLSRILAPLLLLQLQPRLGIPTSALRPITTIGQLSCPVLIVAGESDRHTTKAESLRLFEAAPDPKQLWLVEGAEHQDLMAYDPDSYAANVLGFLRLHLLGFDQVGPL